MKLYIEIETSDQAATDDPHGEAIKVLETCIKHIDNGIISAPLRDTNGNRIGKISFDK